MATSKRVTRQALRSSVQFSSVTQSFPTLCKPMDCNTQGFSVQQQLPELAQIHVHQVSDAIQLSSSVIPFSSCLQSFPASGSFPMSQVFFCIRWPKYWSFRFSINPSKEYSGLISFRMDWLDLLAVQGTLKSSPTPQFKSINSSVLSLLHSPTLTSIHDHRKNHSLD